MNRRLMNKRNVLCLAKMTTRSSAAAESPVTARRCGFRRIGAAVFVALACGFVPPLFAHHSPAAFDRTKQVTLVGTVKEFRWQNPHTWIEVVVPGDKGEEVVWGVEMTSPTFLVRAGWKSTTLKPGDKVTVVGNPVRSGEPSAIFLSLTLADGRTLYERPARLGSTSTSGRE